MMSCNVVDCRRPLFNATHKIDLLQMATLRDYVSTKTHANADKNPPLENYDQWVASATISVLESELKYRFARRPFI
jgi:hypothetical protein